MRRSNRTNVAIVSLTLVSLGAFVVFGWLSVEAGTLGARLGPKAWREALASPTDLLHGTALMFVAYTGYGRIATLGEEMREPGRNIPRAIIATLALSLLLYVSVAATTIVVVGPVAFAASTEGVAAPLEVVARSFRHPQVAWLVALGSVTAMAGVLLNLLLGLSRMLLAMARRREMPGALDYVSDATKSPTRAVWAVGAAIAALVLLGRHQGDLVVQRLHRPRLLRDHESRGAPPPRRGPTLPALDRRRRARELLRPRLLRGLEGVAHGPRPPRHRLGPARMVSLPLALRPGGNRYFPSATTFS